MKTALSRKLRLIPAYEYGRLTEEELTPNEIMKTEDELIDEFVGLNTPNPSCDSLETPRYDKSWDWLMPVVLRAKRTPHSANWTGWTILNNYLLSCDITNVYEELVKFIKWYNQNKPS